MLGTWKVHKQSTHTCHLFTMLKEGSCFVSEFSGLLRSLSITGKLFMGLTESYWTFLILTTQPPLLLPPPVFTPFTICSCLFALHKTLLLFFFYFHKASPILLLFDASEVSSFFIAMAIPEKNLISASGALTHPWEHQLTCDPAAGSAGLAVRPQANVRSSSSSTGSRALA